MGYCNLRNAVKIESIMGKKLTIIDCQGKNRHLSIVGPRNITLIGITLMNGDSGHEDGGCVSITRGVLTLVDSLLVNCRSGGSGGAIYVSIRSLIDIRRSEFDGCQAIGNGGCLTIKNSTLKLTQSTIRDGHSAQLGGAPYLQDISDLTVSATSISGCTAAGGGAMAFRGVRIEAQVSGVAFSNNAATSYQDGMMSGGGAVLVLDKTAVNLTSCLFTDNSANYSGGALRIDTSSSMTATSSDFLRNTARLFGGCVRVGEGSSFLGYDNMFDTNLGYKGAGVIAFSDTSSGGVLVNSRFIFDQQTAWLGGAESVTQNLAMCLAGTQDGLPGDHSGAFLQQPCVDCTTAQCWGLLQVGWTGTSCQVLADGWRPSRFDRFPPAPPTHYYLPSFETRRPPLPLGRAAARRIAPKLQRDRLHGGGGRIRVGPNAGGLELGSVSFGASPPRALRRYAPFAYAPIKIHRLGHTLDQKC